MMLLSNKMLYDATYLSRTKSKTTRNKARKLSKANNKDIRMTLKYQLWTSKYPLGVIKKLLD